jgi:hypothetical protein
VNDRVLLSFDRGQLKEQSRYKIRVLLEFYCIILQYFIPIAWVRKAACSSAPARHGIRRSVDSNTVKPATVENAHGLKIPPRDSVPADAKKAKKAECETLARGSDAE